MSKNYYIEEYLKKSIRTDSKTIISSIQKFSIIIPVFVSVSFELNFVAIISSIVFSILFILAGVFVKMFFDEIIYCMYATKFLISLVLILALCSINLLLNSFQPFIENSNNFILFIFIVFSAITIISTLSCLHILKLIKNGYYTKPVKKFNVNRNSIISVIGFVVAAFFLNYFKSSIKDFLNVKIVLALILLFIGLIFCYVASNWVIRLYFLCVSSKINMTK